MPVLSTGSQIVQWHSSFKVSYALMGSYCCYCLLHPNTETVTLQGCNNCIFPCPGFSSTARLQSQPAPVPELLVQQCEQMLFLPLWPTSVTRSCTPNPSSAPAGAAKGTVTAGTPFCETPGGPEIRDRGMCTAHFCARSISQNQRMLRVGRNPLNVICSNAPAIRSTSSTRAARSESCPT